MRRILPTPGTKYGEWTYLGQYDGVRWLCRCSCGQEQWVMSGHVRSGRSKSCHGKVQVTHGQSHTKLYRAWHCIKQRVRKDPLYQSRQMHESWLHDFTAFAAEIGQPPSPRHSIERRDNAKGYVPGNVVWALPQEQARNRSSNHWLTIDGVEAALTDWCALTGVNVSTAINRMRHYKCTPAQAVGLEPPPWGRDKRK